MNRRELLTGFAPNKTRFVPHPASPGPRKYTNALFKTQDGKEVRFYDDLIKGRQAVINFMYADCHGACPRVTATMVKIYNELKHRMGRDLFFYSISVKPEEDDPAALKAYAKMHGADLPGWTFLTGDMHDVDTLRFRFFRMNHPGIDLDFAMHAGTFRIINDATNTWTTAEAFASMKMIMLRISWADPVKSPEEIIKANKALAEEIDKEVKLYGYRKHV
jgi:protein SCO1/2